MDDRGRLGLWLGISLSRMRRGARPDDDGRGIFNSNQTNERTNVPNGGSVSGRTTADDRGRRGRPARCADAMTDDDGRRRTTRRASRVGRRASRTHRAGRNRRRFERCVNGRKMSAFVRASRVVGFDRFVHRARSVATDVDGSRGQRGVRAETTFPFGSVRLKEKISFHSRAFVFFFLKKVGNRALALSESNQINAQ